MENMTQYKGGGVNLWIVVGEHKDEGIAYFYTVNATFDECIDQTVSSVKNFKEVLKRSTIHGEGPFYSKFPDPVKLSELPVKVQRKLAMLMLVCGAERGREVEGIGGTVSGLITDIIKGENHSRIGNKVMYKLILEEGDINGDDPREES